MSFDPLSAALDVGKIIIERVWPDPEKQAEELRKLAELKQNGDLAELNAHIKMVAGQLNVNAIEASHKSIFVAGWRPFVGWVGGFSLGYAGVIHPLLSWGWGLLQAADVIPAGIMPPPLIESGVLGGIVTGMLGIGGMRSFDKKNNSQTDAI